MVASRKNSNSAKIADSLEIKCYKRLKIILYNKDDHVEDIAIFAQRLQIID
jgi:hypothetical protein